MVAATSDLLPHPFDPLSKEEIQHAVNVVKKTYGDLLFNVVSLHEPRKAEMTKWLEDSSAPRPARIADVVAIAPGGKVYDALVDLASGNITKWELLDGLHPIVGTQRIHALGKPLLTTWLDHNGRAPGSRTCLP
jgi:primary-amine oxidase